MRLALSTCADGPNSWVFFLFFFIFFLVYIVRLVGKIWVTCIKQHKRYQYYLNYYLNLLDFVKPSLYLIRFLVQSILDRLETQWFKLGIERFSKTLYFGHFASNWGLLLYWKTILYGHPYIFSVINIIKM